MRGKGLPGWVIFSELYLSFLQSQEPMMLKGKKGFSTRGWWLMSIGIVIPGSMVFFDFIRRLKKFES